MTDIVWAPSPERVAAANMTAFLAAVQAKVPEAGITDYASLWRWSVAQPERFWPLVWEFCGVIAEERPGRSPWDAVAVGLDRMGPPDAERGPRWFPGARLNFAENLLRYADEHEALVFWNEDGRQHALSYAELHAAVARFARSLRAHGVAIGDRVAGFLPNLPQTVIAMLATTSIGAIWSSCSPDFGAKGVLDRFGQIRPRILVAADGYRYGGKVHDSLARVREVVDAIPEIERVVVVPYLHEVPELAGIRGARTWAEFTRGEDVGGVAGRDGGVDAAPAAFERLPFDHPVYVMYSSGTTGLPKCMVHGAGGTLLQHLKEHRLHVDLHRGDRIFYYTTCGWMMWNWLVSALAVGATVILYDGAPMHPDPGALWRMAEREAITVFGTSAKYIALLEKCGAEPGRDHDLSALRTILSTGSPLAAHGFDWVRDHVGPGVQLASISGGTDIVSCFALGNPIAPVYRGELQTRGLGMAVEIRADDGEAVRDRPGELVCTRPFPSMPVAFWDDPDGAKYRAAYFERWPGVWCHGDWAELTEHDGIVIYGRSDATLNPGGVRIGTAEIYRQVEQLPEIVESLVVGQEWEDDVRIVLFVRLAEGAALDDGLRDRIRRRIREHTSPHHVPKKIVQVSDIPRTISGKITELAVREVIHGRPVKNVDALANPAALEQFRDRAELAS